MTTDYIFETFWWVPHILNHSKFDITVPNDIRVRLVLLLTFRGSLLTLKTWLIEVHLLTHDDCLG